jgi:hypothetical protein
MTDPSKALTLSLVPLSHAAIAVMCFYFSSLFCFLSFSLLPSYSFFIPPFFSFFCHLAKQLFLNYLLYYANISFCRQVPFVNVTGFLVCRYYCHLSFGQCIYVSPIFHLPLNFTQNMFCWSETLNFKPGMVGHTCTQAFLGWGREIEIQGQPGINSEFQMSVWLKWYSSALQAWTTVLKLQDNKKIIKLQLSLCDRRKTYKSQSQSFVLVILGSQEAKIRRIVIQNQHKSNCS